MYAKALNFRVFHLPLLSPPVNIIINIIVRFISILVKEIKLRALKSYDLEEWLFRNRDSNLVHHIGA